MSRNENISYDIPNTLSKRGPSLGYGDRSSFFKKSSPFLTIMLTLYYLGDAPAPTTYKAFSDFDSGNPHGRAFSFGIAREAYSKVYIKENPPNDKSIPGPGTYVVPPKIGNEAKKYSLYGRNANHSTQHFNFFKYKSTHPIQMCSAAHNYQAEPRTRCV
ncbi:MAG: hypothetical protein ACMG6E_09205 [Candidatus Roizmanbacteria bacterium]